MKKFFQNTSSLFLKCLFCFVCYIITIAFAFCSGYFTVIFYSTGYTGLTLTIIMVLAGLFEFTKTLMSICYPFMNGRNRKVENIVKIYLRVALIMSILASLSFFLAGKEIKEAPPTQIVTIFYSYLPILDIIPIRLVQFVVTMSLSVFIEVLIIIIPTIAVIFFSKRNENQEPVINTNGYVDKIKQFTQKTKDRIVDSVPIFGSNISEKAQNKTVDLNKYRDTDIKAVDKNFNDKVVDMQYGKHESNYQENENPENTEIDETRKIGYEQMTQVNSIDIEKKNFNKDDVKSYLDSMYELSKYKKDNESVGQLKIEKDTGLTNKQMRFIRGYLEKLNIIKVSGKKTLILLTYNKALEKLKAV